MTTSRVAVPALLAASLFVVSCVERQVEMGMPGTSMPTPAKPQPVGAAPPADTSNAAPLSTVLTSDPAQLQQMFAAAAGAPIAAVAPGGAAGDPIEDGIKTTAYKQAPGMQPDGPISKGTLNEKSHAEMWVTLAVGKCYSIVGYSPVKGILDLDLHLLSPPLYNILAGEDTTDDNMPVIAKTPNPICPSVPVQIPYKVDVFADRGAGAFGVQLFSRPK